MAVPLVLADSGDPLALLSGPDWNRWHSADHSVPRAVVQIQTRFPAGLHLHRRSLQHLGRVGHHRHPPQLDHQRLGQRLVQQLDCAAGLGLSHPSGGLLHLIRDDVEARQLGLASGLQLGSLLDQQETRKQPQVQHRRFRTQFCHVSRYRDLRCLNTKYD